MMSEGRMMIGVYEPKPARGFPEGRVKWIMRPSDYVRAAVRTADGLRIFAVRDAGDAWEPIPGCEIGANRRAWQRETGSRPLMVLLPEKQSVKEWAQKHIVPETALDQAGGEALGTPSPDPVQPVSEEGVVTLDDLPMSDRLLRTITWNKGPALGGGGTNGIKDGVSWWWDGDKLLLIGGTRGGQIVDLVRVSADEHFLNFEDVETGENHDWSPEDIWWWAKVEDDMLPPAASYDVPPAEHLNP
jgi:hypothetical protein